MYKTRLRAANRHKMFQFNEIYSTQSVVVALQDAPLYKLTIVSYSRRDSGAGKSN